MAESYLKYNKKQLINLNYSLSKELLRTSRNGGYSSSTIIGCNTRKYHGLLVAPQELIDGERHVLLSTVDETLILNDAEFHLSSRIFPGGIIYPKGHKYIRNFNSDPNLKLTYRIGKTIFHKEYIFIKNESRLLLRYTLEDSAVASIVFRISPFLAYRSIHELSKSNLWVNNKYVPVENGVFWQMYEGYSRLYFQTSKTSEYTHNPDWHFDIEYPREQERGYAYKEDLFVPGFFDIPMKKGESIVISIGLEEKPPGSFKRAFTSEIKNRTSRKNFKKCLQNAADEFIIKQKNKTEIIAGYHWFGKWGRDTFIALPGLTLTQDKEPVFHAVMKSMIKELSNGNFPNLGSQEHASYNAIDTSFWFFRALHKFALMTGKNELVWQTYGKTIKSILLSFKKGETASIQIHENGLIWAGEHGKAMSWMDASVKGMPVVPRKGYLVEINAIWYDAINFFLELAKENGDTSFVKEWADISDKIRKSFLKIFWNEKKGQLADFVDENGANWDIRPNMVFAVSEPYSPLKSYQKEYVLKKLIDDLLTPKGLRSLSPKNSKYRGKYEGNQEKRDKAYHQGTVWPWLLGAFAEAYLKLHKKSGKAFIKKILLGFENEMQTRGIGTISEIYDGNPPFEARGAISQAWSVAEILRVSWMLDND